MTYVKGQDRQQIILLPDCIDDLVEQDNPVRVIDAFIDRLDIEEAGFQRSTPSITGRPCYNPRDLLKLYVYGYFNKIRSSRKLMAECGRNIELFFLLNRLIPDLRTISDFRKDNAKALRNVFHTFVKTCTKLDLYQKNLLTIDCSKFNVVNSKQNAYNQDILRRKLTRVDENIPKYLFQMNKYNTDQQDSSDKIADRCQKFQPLDTIYKFYLFSFMVLIEAIKTTLMFEHSELNTLKYFSSI